MWAPDTDCDLRHHRFDRSNLPAVYWSFV